MLSTESHSLQIKCFDLDQLSIELYLPESDQTVHLLGCQADSQKSISHFRAIIEKNKGKINTLVLEDEPIKFNKEGNVVDLWYKLGRLLTQFSATETGKR